MVDGNRYVLDLAYPDVKLAIEYDGFEIHSTRTAFDHDRRRANRLIASGWTIVRVTQRGYDDESDSAAGRRASSQGQFQRKW